MYLKKSNYYLLTAFTMLFGCLIMFNACTEDLCEGVECGENGINCDEVTGECICEFGWYSDGGRCNKVDSCLIEPLNCPDNASCNSDTYVCECDEGFYGPDCASMNPCADIECPDNASCDSTTLECLCDVGFSAVEGECVADVSVSSYYGNWTETDDCSDGNIYEDIDVVITAVDSPDDFDRFSISNLGGFGTGTNVECILSSDDPLSFTIPNQTSDGRVFESIDAEGNAAVGSFFTNSNSFAIVYTVTGSDGPTTCTATFVAN